MHAKAYIPKIVFLIGTITQFMIPTMPENEIFRLYLVRIANSYILSNQKRLNFILKIVLITISIVQLFTLHEE